MIKLSRILASIISIILILTATLLSVAAVTDKQNQLWLTGDGIIPALAHEGKYKASTDFEDKTLISVDGTANLKTAVEAFVGPWENTYARVQNDGATVTSTSAYFDWRFARGDLEKSSAMNSDFYVYDMEIAADSFLVSDFPTAGKQTIIQGNYLDRDSNGFAVWTNAATGVIKDTSGNAVVEGEKLILADGSSVLYDDLVLSYQPHTIEIVFRSYNNAEGGASAQRGIAVASIDYLNNNGENSWYVSFNGTKVNLSKNVGEWNHLTFVFKIDNSITATKIEGGTEIIDYDYELCDEISLGKSEKYSDFKTNLKNTKLYCYFNGNYVASKGVFTASQVNNIANFGSMEHLNNFRPAYVRHTYSNATAMYSVCYDNIAANWYADGYEGNLADHILNNPTDPINLCDDVVYSSAYIAPAPSVKLDICSASVYSDAQAQNLISSYITATDALEAASALKTENPDNDYFVIIERSQSALTVSDKVIAGIYVKTADESVSFDLADNQHLLLGAADENGYQKLVSNVGYEISYSDGNKTVAWGSSNFRTNVQNATSGATVKLLGDIEIDCEGRGINLIVIDEGETINVDLNGYDLYVINAISTTKLFVPQNNTTLNIYSSRPGGSLSNAEGRFFQTSGGVGISINLGAYGEYSGDNLSAYARMLHYDATAVANTGDNEINTINLNGGAYYFHHNASQLMWAFNSWKLNITDAKVISHGGTYAMFYVSSSDAQLHVNAKNSYIISTTNDTNAAPGSIIGSCGDKVCSFANSSFSADNCVLVGKISVSGENHNNASISLTNGTKLYSNTAKGEYESALSDNGFRLVRTSEYVSVNYACSYRNASGSPGSFSRTLNVSGAKYAYTAIDESSVPNTIKANVSTNNGFLVNFAIPENSTITIIKGATENGTIIIDDVVYNVYTTGAISPASVDDASISYSFTIGDGFVTYTTEASLSLLNYFESALENAKETGNKLQKALIVNAANYCNEVYKYATGNSYDGYADIVDEAEDGMIVTTFDSAVSILHDDEKKTITNAQLIVGTGNVPVFAFGAVDIKTSVYAIYTDISGNKIAVECGIELVLQEYYYVIENMKNYDMISTVTLSLDENGAEKLLEYNLAAYINSAAGKAMGIDDALYSFAVASFNYKTN